MTDELMMAEWELWKDICRQLVALGAVDRADLDAPQGAIGTPALKLLNALKRWGDYRHEQGKAAHDA